MSLRLNQRSDSPGLTYTNPESGHKLFAWDIKTLMGLIREYRKNNSFPNVTQEDVEDQICRTLPPDWCHYSTGGAPSDFINTSVGLSDVLRGTLALGEIAARRLAATLVPSYSPFVDQATAEARAAVCASCYAKTPIQGCRSCSDYSTVVGSVIGDRKTKSDAMLVGQACAVCKCSARAQIHITTEILNRGVDYKMLAAFQSIGHCWKGKEITQYRLTLSEPSGSTPP